MDMMILALASFADASRKSSGPLSLQSPIVPGSFLAGPSPGLTSGPSTIARSGVACLPSSSEACTAVSGEASNRSTDLGRAPEVARLEERYVW